MVETNSEIEPEKMSRIRGFICALVLLVLFALIYFAGYYGGLAIIGRQQSVSICTRGYSGTPCRPNGGQR